VSANVVRMYYFSLVGVFPSDGDSVKQTKAAALAKAAFPSRNSRVVLGRISRHRMSISHDCGSAKGLNWPSVT
jgi:hypothetical protein